MNCEKYVTLFDELLEGELDDASAFSTNTHALDCGDCSAELEMRRSERDLYAHYLFEIEPPTDLSARFETRLAELPVIEPKQLSIFASLWPTFRLSYAMVLASAVLVFGAGYLWIDLQTKSSSSPERSDLQAKLNAERRIAPESRVVETKNEGPEAKTISATLGNPRNRNRSFVITPSVIQKASLRPVKPDDNTTFPRLTEADKLQIREAMALEMETAKQIEKVELLLRSFRNTRYADGREEYDIAYEKQQARRLLDKNVQLRQQAETIGRPYSRDLLSRVEPYLLDIANLNSNPTSTEVIEIKERVKNQKIIASLQSF